jgi:hypothetical protein
MVALPHPIASKSKQVDCPSCFDFEAQPLGVVTIDTVLGCEAGTGDPRVARRRRSAAAGGVPPIIATTSVRDETEFVSYRRMPNEL